MTILVDTHVFLWFILDDPKLPTKAKSLFRISSNVLSGLFSADASPENVPVGTATRNFSASPRQKIVSEPIIQEILNRL